MKDKFVKYFFVFIIIVMAIISINNFLDNVRLEKETTQTRRKLIEQDSLRKVSSTEYKKIVNDLITQKELNLKIREEREELYKRILAEEKRPVSYTIIEAKPNTKVDTTTVTKGESGGSKITSFYPQENNYFVKYEGELKDSTLISSWGFGDLEIGIIISEREDGVFEADLEAPDWLTVKELEVNSLPIIKKEEDNFDWLVGTSVGKNLNTDLYSMDLEVGVRINKSIVSVLASSNTDLKVGYKILF